MMSSCRHEAFAAWLNLRPGVAADRTIEAFERVYLGHFVSLSAYVEQFVDEMGYEAMLDAALPSAIRPYARIDSEGLARDVSHFGSVLAVPAPSGGVCLFEASP